MRYRIDEDLLEEGDQGQADSCPVALGFARERGLGPGERVVCLGDELQVKDEEADEVIRSWSCGAELEAWVRAFDGRAARAAEVPVVVEVDVHGHTARLVEGVG